MVYINSFVSSGARVVRSDASRSLRLSHFANTASRASSCPTSPTLSRLRLTAGQLQTRTYASTTPKLSTSSRTAARYQTLDRQIRSSNNLKLSRTQIRSCSYQRNNMCRHSHGADVAEGAVDVTAGREVLPTNVKPLHYRLTLEPNLETFEYIGTVEIEYAGIYQPFLESLLIM